MRIIEIIVGILLIVFLFVLAFGNRGFFAFAMTADQLEQQIESANNRIKKIEEEIRQLGSNIAATSQERLTLENELKRIEQSRQTLLKELSLTSTKINKTNLSIQNLNGEITEKQQKIELQKKSMSKTIRRLSEYDDFTPLELLLSETDISNFWEELSELQTIQAASRKQVRTLQGIQEELGEVVQEKEAEKEELVILKTDIENQKKLVEQNKQEQAELVSETKNKEEIFKQQLAAKQAQRKAFEDELKEYESQLQFLANPNALPQAGSAPLSWPLDAIVVTQQFGAKTGPHRTYAYGHSGTDFRARTPQKVYAMADGVVMGTGNTDVACKGVSFGQWVAIKHDNGLVSTSAHLSIRSVQKGDRVSRGQVIGYSGNTGRSTAPHLHISLYAGVDANGNNPVEIKGAPSIACSGKTLIQPRASRDAYLDPLDYLPATTSANFKPGVPF